MKKLSITIILLVLVGMAMAQPPGDENFQHREGPDLEKLSILLDLTDEQVVQWKEMQEKFAADRKVQFEKMKTEREQNREEHANALKQILTEEQYVKFEALRPDQPERQHSKHQNNQYKHGDCGQQQGTSPENGQNNSE